MSSFLGLQETIAAHGLFSSFYTDRGSHYFVTPKAGAKVDKTHLTQVGQALAQLGIRHIPPTRRSTRAMERVFGTLQQRLPPELRRAGVANTADANIYLRESFVPATTSASANRQRSRHGLCCLHGSAVARCAVRADGPSS